MLEVLLAVAVLLLVGGLGLMVVAVRQLKDLNPKPRYRRNGGKF